MRRFAGGQRKNGTRACSRTLSVSSDRCQRVILRHSRCGNGYFPAHGVSPPSPSNERQVQSAAQVSYARCLGFVRGLTEDQLIDAHELSAVDGQSCHLCSTRRALKEHLRKNLGESSSRWVRPRTLTDTVHLSDALCSAVSTGAWDVSLVPAHLQRKRTHARAPAQDASQQLLDLSQVRAARDAGAVQVLDQRRDRRILSAGISNSSAKLRALGMDSPAASGGAASSGR